MVSDGNIFLIVLFIVFCVALAVQMAYYLRIYLAPVLYRENPPDVNEKPPVSVIICARNEAENLASFLPLVLEQEYPAFEVIVVNDCSEDRSDDILGELLPQYPHLRVSTIQKDPKFTHNKKFAQFIGIKAAANEILVFTDADCQPESPEWLSGMAGSFSDDVNFVLGYGGYIENKSLLNSYIRYDTLFIAMQYFGMALRGMPYMGVGRNMAYRRSLFFASKGFGTHTHVVSGDDDLFINSNAKGPDTRVVMEKDYHTRSVPASSAGEWVKQKQRHFTTAPYYKLRDKLLLMGEPLSRTLFYLSFIVLVANTFLWPYAIGLFLLRMITLLVISNKIHKRLNEQRLLGLSLIFDIFSPLINLALYLGSIRNRGAVEGWK